MNRRSRLCYRNSLKPQVRSIAVDACSTKPRDRRPFEEYRKLAKEATKKLEPEIEVNDSVTWDRVMEVADREEVVYKLTLKYLRQDGYDIGNYKNPFVRK